MLADRQKHLGSRGVNTKQHHKTHAKYTSTLGSRQQVEIARLLGCLQQVAHERKNTEKADQFIRGGAAQDGFGIEHHVREAPLSKWTRTEEENNDNTGHPNPTLSNSRHFVGNTIFQPAANNICLHPNDFE
jgi:hypothetical protein